MTEIEIVDVLVLGAGPGGLSAALALGRGMKRVLVCDMGKRRNAAAEHMHGFVSRDGISPSEFRRVAREQLRPYGVAFKEAAAERMDRIAADIFQVALSDGSLVNARRILIATGMIDVLPNIAGLADAWGHTVFTCPYCHGWEMRGREWAMLATDEALLEYAVFLTGWTRDVVAFTNGRTAFTAAAQEQCQRAGVRIETRPIARIVLGGNHHLMGLEFSDGSFVPRQAMVVRPPQRQVGLVEQLGLALDARGFVRVDESGATSVPGIYAAGDLTSPLQTAVLAAAAGTRAAYALNHELTVQQATTFVSSAL